jgi:predicted Rossmann fold flavoprotein
LNTQQAKQAASAVVDVIVVGAGAAGLLAAGTAATRGASVLILEKMPRPGMKLSITGKGRCNLTNSEPRKEFDKHFGGGADWLKFAFDGYFSDSLMAFLEAEGIALVTERGGRVFPANGRAPDVVKTLLDWVRRLGVSMRLRESVTELLVDKGRIVGVKTQSGEFRGKAVIVACGGMSYPATGSTGDGYRLVGMTGHAIATPRASLVPLVTDPPPARDLAGLSLRNVGVRLRVGADIVAEAFGEMGFTDYGVNGPVVLSLSGRAVEALDAGRSVQLIADLKPALGNEKLEARISRDLAKRQDEPMRSILRGLLPKPLVKTCLAATGIRGSLPGRKMTGKQGDVLRQWLKAMVLDISGHRGMKEAIVTAGGVCLDDVDPRTMASHRVTGLFFAGELLDLQADTGGYNLQAAFSTGVLAGRSAVTLTETS